jgi:hypothetical protein
VAALLFVKCFVSLTVAPVTSPKMFREMLLDHCCVAFRRRRLKKTKPPLYFFCVVLCIVPQLLPLLPPKKKNFGEKPTLNPPSPRFNVPKWRTRPLARRMAESVAGGCACSTDDAQCWGLAVVKCEPGKDLSAIETVITLT